MQNLSGLCGSIFSLSRSPHCSSGGKSNKFLILPYLVYFPTLGQWPLGVLSWGHSWVFDSAFGRAERAVGFCACVRTGCYTHARVWGWIDFGNIGDVVDLGGATGGAIGIGDHMWWEEPHKANETTTKASQIIHLNALRQIHRMS